MPKRDDDEDDNDVTVNVHRDGKDIERKLDQIISQLNRLERKDTKLTASVDAIRTEVANLRTTQTEIADAITALAGRLSDNPTETEVAAVATELAEVAAGFSGFNESLDSLDPAVPTGAVTEEAPEE